jgi:hypothetical protein
MEVTMRTLRLLVSFILITPATSFSQITFERAYGGYYVDEAYSVQQTADGGYVITGYTESFGAGSADVGLLKTDASGDILWGRTYGGIGVDHGHEVQQTADGGYVIIGYTESFGAGDADVYLIKTDASGDILWERTYGGNERDDGNSVKQTPDGGYVITGFTKSFGAGSADVFLLKTDASGDILWARTYGGYYVEDGNEVQQTADGGYIIAGYTELTFGGNRDFLLIKTDSFGESQWSRISGGKEWEMYQSVQQTADGGYIVTGHTSSFGYGSGDVCLVKTDALGYNLWRKTYGGSDYDDGRSIQQTADGGYIIAGWTMSFGAGDRDVYLIKTDSSGYTLWMRAYGGISDDRGYSVQQTTDGGYVITGYTQSFGAGYSDVYLIKTDAEGYVE